MPKELFPALISAVSGLVGVLIGALISGYNQRKEREQRFLREQLTEFYGPMQAIRVQLRVRRETELKVSSNAGSAWNQRVIDAQKTGVEEVEKLTRESFPAYAEIIQYNNKQFESEIIPLYRRMEELFVAKMYLTQSSTRQHFAALSEFVELWRRWIEKSIPGEVVSLDPPTETKLQPLYEDVEKHFEHLQSLLKKG